MAVRKQPAARDALGNPVDPRDVYVALDGLSTGPNGEYVVARGTRLRGSAPAVQHASSLFVPDGTPDDEVAGIRQRVWPGTPG